MANKEIGRRDFLKKLGLAGAVVSGTSLASCSSDNKSAQKWSVEGTGGEPTGEMTYRTNPNTGDKVSLLGYGCMRWPMKKNEEGKDIVDQEKVNELVDYAIEHGVNFFAFFLNFCEKIHFFTIKNTAMCHKNSTFVPKINF